MHLNMIIYSLKYNSHYLNGISVNLPAQWFTRCIRSRRIVYFDDGAILSLYLLGPIALRTDINCIQVALEIAQNTLI